jgi:hypothetical protein
MSLIWIGSNESTNHLQIEWHCGLLCDYSNLRKNEIHASYIKVASLEPEKYWCFVLLFRHKSLYEIFFFILFSAWIFWLSVFLIGLLSNFVLITFFTNVYIWEGIVNFFSFDKLWLELLFSLLFIFQLSDFVLFMWILVFLPNNLLFLFLWRFFVWKFPFNWIIISSGIVGLINFDWLIEETLSPFSIFDRWS